MVIDGEALCLIDGSRMKMTPRAEVEDSCVCAVAFDLMGTEEARWVKN